MILRNASDMTEQKVTTLSQGSYMHTVLRRRVFLERSSLVARGNDILNFGMTLWKMGNEVHFLPAVFLLSVNSGKSKTLEGIPLHKVESAVFLRIPLLAGLS